MKKKIFLINNDESIREIFQMYLELKNYEVYQIIDAKIAIEQAKTILPDLVLLDVMLPEINGYEICRLLKQDPKTKDIPVIFISSLLETSEKIKGLECGGVDFINNMADYAEILARIETHLKIKELNHQLQVSNQELMIKQKSLDEDLRAAGIIQQNLLPTRLPYISNVEVAWSCHPCEMVGGDICNISPINDDLSIFYVLDVSGHGVPSAMVTVSVTQYLQQKQLAKSALSPKEILTSLNKEYPFEKFNMFSTIFYTVFNNKSGKLIYSSAGHPPAIYLSPKKPLRLLNTEGSLIGIDPLSPYEEKEEVLEEGEKIILYTDGIVEFNNPAGEFYGNERFYTLLEEIKTHSIKEIIRIVNDSLKDFGCGKTPRDDISILGIEYK